MALALDAANSAVATTATSNVISLTTVAANTMIVVAVLTNTNATGAARTVTSVTASGLTFVKRGAVTQINALSDGQNLEWWWALASSAGAKSITVNFSGAPDLSSVIAFSVSGGANGWDAGSVGGFTNANSLSTGTTVNIPGVSTSSAASFLFSFVAIDQNAFASFPCAAGLYTEITDVNNSNNTWGNLGGDYQVFASTQASFTKGFKTGGAFDSSGRWIAMADAIVVSSATRTPTLTLMGVG